MAARRQIGRLRIVLEAPVRKPFFFVGVYLHCVDENGQYRLPATLPMGGGRRGAVRAWGKSLQAFVCRKGVSSARERDAKTACYDYFHAAQGPDFRLCAVPATT